MHQLGTYLIFVLAVSCSSSASTQYRYEWKTQITFDGVMFNALIDGNSTLDAIGYENEILNQSQLLIENLGDSNDVDLIGFSSVLDDNDTYILNVSMYYTGNTSSLDILNNNASYGDVENALEVATIFRIPHLTYDIEIYLLEDEDIISCTGTANREDEFMSALWHFEPSGPGQYTFWWQITGDKGSRNSSIFVEEETIPKGLEDAVLEILNTDLGYVVLNTTYVIADILYNTAVNIDINEFIN